MSNALYLVYFQSDVAVMGTLARSEQVGLYAAACSILSVALVASTALMNDVMRARLYKERFGTRAFREVATRARNVALILGPLVGGAIAAAAPMIVRVIFGPTFDGSVGLLRILGVGICLYYWSNWVSNVLIAGGNATAVVGIQLLLAIVNVSLNVALIPRFGAAGSAWITAACEGVGILVFGAVLVGSRTLRVADASP